MKEMSIVAGHVKRYGYISLLGQARIGNDYFSEPMFTRDWSAVSTN